MFGQGSSLKTSWLTGTRHRCRSSHRPTTTCKSRDISWLYNLYFTEFKISNKPARLQCKAQQATCPGIATLLSLGLLQVSRRYAAKRVRHFWDLDLWPFGGQRDPDHALSRCNFLAGACHYPPLLTLNCLHWSRSDHFGGRTHRSDMLLRTR